jgi:hypothetical protein
MNRTDLLNHLAEKYNLQRYLEIGVQNTAQNFDKINCPYKVCVDPDPAANATFCLTSDEYFALAVLNIGHRYDLIFIDGLHTAEQVKQDFENALSVLSPKGFIVLHDCNPLKEEHTIVPRPTKTGHWNGDVYRFAAGLVYPKWTVDIDNGCMVIQHRWPNPASEFIEWQKFNQDRKKLLNLISWDEFVNL